MIPGMEFFVSRENLTSSPSGSLASKVKEDVKLTRAKRVLPSSSTFSSIARVILGGLLSGQR